MSYTLSTHDGRPALYNNRGLVCTFEAGDQATRMRDAINLLTALEVVQDFKHNYNLLTQCEGWNDEIASNYTVGHLVGGALQTTYHNAKGIQ